MSDDGQRNGSGRSLKVVAVAAVVLATLSAVKFLNLLVEAGFDIAQAPVAFLLPIILLVVGAILAARSRRSGVWITGAVCLVLLGVLISAVVRLGTAQQDWADALLVFAGIPVAVAGLIAAVDALRQRPAP